MTTDYELSDRIEELSEYRASGDYLLTVAVPPDEPVGTVLERVEEEHAEAEYLDGETADDAVRRVLDEAVHLLHDYEESGTPENGLVCYVGVVDGDLVEHVFDALPTPVAESVYHRDNEFDVSPLERTTGESRTYGLLVVERGGAALGRLVGDEVEHVETIESNVMGKTRAGGQSAQRFARERERQKHEFFEEVGDEARRAFLDAPEVENGATGNANGAGGNGNGDGESEADETDGIDGLLVGGSTVAADDFLDGDYLDYRLDDALVGGRFAVEYASEQGLHQLVDRARDELEAADQRPAREALDEFFDRISAGDPVVYGPDEAAEALEYGAVDTTLCSSGLSAETIRDWEERTEEEGGDLVVVPEELDRGARFREAFGGVGALLRFPIE